MSASNAERLDSNELQGGGIFLKKQTWDSSISQGNDKHLLTQKGDRQGRPEVQDAY